MFNFDRKSRQAQTHNVKAMVRIAETMQQLACILEAQIDLFGANSVQADVVRREIKHRKANSAFASIRSS